jgi:excinuclease ABC subunit A
VIKTADRIIDLGPEGGEEGGALVAQGTPEQVAGAADRSHTGRFLEKIVKPTGRRKRGTARAKVPAAA